MASFKTIASPSGGRFTEKMSRFLAFAFPVEEETTARQYIKKFQNDYHDARHVCWAYMIGADRNLWQINDNGEPSGTAGKPILGQINSAGITNVLVIVVRYFGGIKLGTPGLIAAYREAARTAIANAEIIEMQEMRDLVITFPYLAMNDVMQMIKTLNLTVKERSFDNVCSITLSVPVDNYNKIKQSLPEGVITSSS